MKANSARQEATAKQTVQQLEQQQARLLQQENEQAQAKSGLHSELEAAKANAKYEADVFVKSQNEQHRFLSNAFSKANKVSFPNYKRTRRTRMYRFLAK